jgi:hypothetical protein
VRSAHGNSLDHLVGAGGEHRRDFNAERLRNLEIDDELEASPPIWSTGKSPS